MKAHDTAVVFVTDSGFLGPSVQAALQLLDQEIDSLADILIYTTQVEPDLTAALSRKLAPRIQIVPLSDVSYVPPAGAPFFRNHVPQTTLARLVIAERLAPQYRNLVYLDGDIQIVGDVRPLVRHRVRDGWIAGVRGSAWLDPDGRFGLTPKGYIESLGDVSVETYFNAGILACRRETWAQYGPMALDVFLRNSETFIRHDQSALNAVFGRNVEPLSPVYNFHNVYAALGGERFVEPKIIHFTGPAKPWKAPTPPWGWRFHQAYVDLVARIPELQDVFRVSPRLAAPAHPLKRAVRASRALVQYPTTLRQRHAFRHYVRSAAFAVR